MQFDLAHPQLRHGQRKEPARSVAAHMLFKVFSLAAKPFFFTKNPPEATRGGLDEVRRGERKKETETERERERERA